MAIACLRLFTVPPVPPLPRFSVPFLRRCRALFTSLDALREYLAIAALRYRGAYDWPMERLPSQPGHAQGNHNSWCNVPELHRGEFQVNAIIYLVGLIVIVLFILSFLGLR
jgi:hypothetical protein